MINKLEVLLEDLKKSEDKNITVALMCNRIKDILKDEPKMITSRDELKEHDIIVLRNGDELVLDEYNDFRDISDEPCNGITDLYCLTDDLKSSDGDKINDVIQVKRPVYTTVFKRDTYKELTVKEISDLLGYDVKIVKE